MRGDVEQDQVCAEAVRCGFLHTLSPGLTMATSPTLIPDLLDAVIAELGSDRRITSSSLAPDAEAALKACVLASPVLRGSAQRQLFKTVYIDSNKRAKQFNEILAGNIEVARSVLKFTASSGPPRFAWMHAQSPFSLTSLLSLLPCLEQFVLFTCDFTKHFASDASRESLYRSLPATVIHFSSGDCTFSDSTQLVDLLRQFKSPLRSFRINIPTWTGDEDAQMSFPPEIAPQALSVHALWGSSDVVRPWFTLFSLQNLTKLDLTLHLPDDVPRWQIALDSAPKLQSINIQQLVLHTTSLNLRSLSELRDLSAEYGHMWDYRVPGNNPDPMRAFCRMLASATGVRLERAKLVFGYHAMELFKLVDWLQLQKDVNRCAWASDQRHFDIILSRKRGEVNEECDQCLLYLESSFEKYDIRGIKVVQEFWEGYRR
jgi:hypothetical protein